MKPKSSAAVAALQLKPKRERSLLAGHPWVFSGAVEKPAQLVDGDLVDVFSHEGRYLASAHSSTQGGIALRILSHSPIVDIRSFLSERLTQAIRLRRALGLWESDATNAFRLVNTEGDFLPGLVIDRYGDSLVMQCHSAGMSLLKPLLHEMLETELGVRTIVDRSPELSREAADEAEEKVQEIKEHEIRYQVSLTQGQKTGFFLDQRENRLLLRSYVAQRRVLNAYCYTGGFSVNAFAGGAAQVVSVDASESACQAAESHVRDNCGTTAAHEVVRADCKRFLPEVPSGAFDTVVLDPPAFVKHAAAKRKGLLAYEATIAQGLRIVSRSGYVFAFSCSPLVSRAEFVEAVSRAAAKSSRFVYCLRQLGAAGCHPCNPMLAEGEYLKGVLLYVD